MDERLRAGFEPSGTAQKVVQDRRQDALIHRSPKCPRRCRNHVSDWCGKSETGNAGRGRPCLPPHIRRPALAMASCRTTDRLRARLSAQAGTDSGGIKLNKRVKLPINVNRISLKCTGDLNLALAQSSQLAAKGGINVASPRLFPMER